METADVNAYGLLAVGLVSTLALFSFSETRLG